MSNMPFDKKDLKMIWWLLKNMIKQFILCNFDESTEAYQLICMFLKYDFKRKEKEE